MRRTARAGSAAIEFALIVPIFLVLLMGTMEVGIMFLGQSVLQNATNDAARMIRTGQVAGWNLNQTQAQAQFRTTICNGIAPILACNSNLQIDVESFSNFSSLSYTNPLTANNTLDPNLANFSPGTVCSVVLVRVFYTWSVITPLLTPFMVNMANNQHLMTAAAAFRNEPYTSAVAGC